MRIIAMVAGTVLVCLFSTPATPEERPTSTGIADYFERRDDAAIAALETAGPDVPLATTLALADLYFMNGRLPRARHLLLQTLAEHPVDDLAIWLAWIEFAAHHRRDAESILEDVVATSDAATGARAILSLAWQRMLTGDSRGAAATFARIEDDASIPGLAEQARLLRGEALMFAHDHTTAEEALRRVTVRSLVADATRDLAWIRHRRGDSAAARADLEALAALEDNGGPDFVPWPRVLRQGGAALGRIWQRAYRDRPRGQDPTTFLMATGDRDAAADARAMLHAFFASAPAGDGDRIGTRVAATDGRPRADSYPVHHASEQQAPLHQRPAAEARSLIVAFLFAVLAVTLRRRRRAGARA